jgi:hypothetical protein
MAYSPALVAEWHSNPPSARTYDLNGYAPDVVEERLELSPAKNREMGRENGKTSFRFDLDFTEDCADGRLRVCSHGETTIILAIGESDYWKKKHLHKFVIRQRIDPVGKREITNCSIPGTQCPRLDSADVRLNMSAVLVAGAVAGATLTLVAAIGLFWRQRTRAPAVRMDLSRSGHVGTTNSPQSRLSKSPFPNSPQRQSVLHRTGIMMSA